MPTVSKEDADNVARAFGPLADREKKDPNKKREDLARKIAMSERPGLVKREY